MECGGKRSATPLWLEFVPAPSQDPPLKPKRRRASLAAALHSHADLCANHFYRSIPALPGAAADREIYPSLVRRRSGSLDHVHVVLSSGAAGWLRLRPCDLATAQTTNTSHRAPVPG